VEALVLGDGGRDGEHDGVADEGDVKAVEEGCFLDEDVADRAHE